jgi:REP element-mobilizing transposase RayT
VAKRDHIDFNNRSIAKGYLITFRCYGTWLHGDERGSMDRRFYNTYGTPNIPADPKRERRKSTQLKTQPFTLGAHERRVVEEAIREVCIHRSYVLYALNVRTNHVHLVVSNSGEPERMMDSFKAYSTRALRSAGLIGADERPWSRHGSTRYLWSEEHIATAVDYVVKGQGHELPTFD